jgi:hypothetical protein
MGLPSSRWHEPRLRSTVRAREPVEWPAFGVGDSRDEQVLLVLFERDHVGEPLDGGLADQRADCARARPCRVGLRGIATSIEAAEASAMNSSPLGRIDGRAACRGPAPSPR